MKELFPCSKSVIRQGLLLIRKALYISLFPIFLIYSISLSAAAQSHALSAQEKSLEDSLQIVIEPSQDDSEINNDEPVESTPKMSSKGYPDLGDDQVFPFAAGLDSY